MLRFILLTLLLTVGFATISDAQTVSRRTATLLWNANTETDLAGYKIYRSLRSCAISTASDFQLLTTVGRVTTYTDAAIPITAMSVCYGVSAFDASNNESGQSAKVGKVAQVAPSAPSRPTFR